VAQRNLIFRFRSAGWVLITTLAIACSSKQVPIGAQTGLGGAAGALGTGGAGVAGAGAGGGVGGAVSTGAGGGKADAGASGGAVGADAASGGAGGTDAATTTDAGSCSASFSNTLTKDCTTASDCVLVRHNDCCGNVITAVRSGTEASFATAEQAFQSCVPGCNVRGCFHADAAENGQTLVATGQAFAAQCQGGRCTSVVTTGSECASDGDCAAGEICVAFVTNLGPTSTTTLSCRGNACGATALSCTCAGSDCTGFFSGICTVNAGRLACDDGRK